MGTASGGSVGRTGPVGASRMTGSRGQARAALMTRGLAAGIRNMMRTQGGQLEDRRRTSAPRSGPCTSRGARTRPWPAGCRRCEQTAKHRVQSELEVRDLVMVADNSKQVLVLAVVHCHAGKSEKRNQERQGPSRDDGTTGEPRNEVVPARGTPVLDLLGTIPANHTIIHRACVTSRVRNTRSEPAQNIPHSALNKMQNPRNATTHKLSWSLLGVGDGAEQDHERRHCTQSNHVERPWRSVKSEHQRKEARCKTRSDNEAAAKTHAAS